MEYQQFWHTLLYITHLLGPIPSGFLSSKIGYKHLSLLSCVPILGFYLIIRAAETPEMFYLASLIGGTGFIMYWMGMNPEMAKSSDEGKEESETGLFFSLPSLATMSSPAIGGAVISLFGFNVLFLLAASLMFISFTPFMLSTEHREGMETDLGDVFNTEMINDFGTFFFKGFIYFLEKVLWPIYLAVVIGGSIDIGIAGTMYALGTAVTSAGIGRYMNTENKKNILVKASFLTAGVTALMATVTTAVTAFILASAQGLMFTALSMSIYSSAIKRAERTDIIEYFAFREIALATGRLTALISVFTIFFFVGQNFIYAFALIALATVMITVPGRKILE